MGNNSTKSDRQDVTQLNNMSQGMHVLRRSMESLPDGTKKFQLVLESNEKKIQDILRRSTRGSTRKKALDMLRDFEDLKEKERNSIRDSSLDHGAVESSSIIAADVKKYDKNRQRDKTVDDLHSLRRQTKSLGSRIDSNHQEEQEHEYRDQLQSLITQLKGLHVQPGSRLEDYKNETMSIMRKCEKKLNEKQLTTSSALDGSASSKMRSNNRPLSEEIKQKNPRVSKSRPQSVVDIQNDITMIHGKVLSLQAECEKFNGVKDSPEYNTLVQPLMKLWDQVGRIHDVNLAAQRDDIIGTISTTLKKLNHRCMDKTRGSLSKNKILGMAEVFHMQYQKIAEWLNSGKAKENRQVYAILNEVQTGLYQLLAKNECQLVTTKMIDSNLREPWVQIHKSSEMLKSTHADKVYIKDEECELPTAMKSNKSCPNLQLGYPQDYQQVTAIYAHEGLPSSKLNNELTSNYNGYNEHTSLMHVLDNLKYESNTLKYAVEKFEANDKEKFEELDERLIAIYIQIESLKGKCSAHEEQLRNSIMQCVQDTRVNLAKKCKTNTIDVVDDYRTDEHLLTIEDILEHLEILKTQINESYDWATDNPEFKVVEDALKSALMRLDLIEPNNNHRVEIAKANAMSDVRQAIERLDMQKYKTSLAGTEV